MNTETIRKDLFHFHSNKYSNLCICMHSSSLPSFLLKLKECHFSYHGQVQLLTPIFSPLLNILLLQLFCLSPTHHQISFSVYYSCQPTNIVFSTQKSFDFLHLPPHTSSLSQQSLCAHTYIYIYNFYKKIISNVNN